MTLQEANCLFRCDPVSGKLFWKPRDSKLFKQDGEISPEVLAVRWNARYADTLAGSTNNNHGYVNINIGGKIYRAHRIIWLMVHGEWPHNIDHLNGVRDDNRITNLRNVSHSENNKNASRRKDNVSGATGVHWYKRSAKWRAGIKVNGKLKHLGSFDTLEDAISARKSAEKEYGFHKNHGRTVQ